MFFQGLSPRHIPEKLKQNKWLEKAAFGAFYKDIFLTKSTRVPIWGLSRTSLCLRSYITRVTLSRPRDNLRLWLWMDGPLRGHDVDFLAQIMMPTARTKQLMLLLSSARQILIVGLMNNTNQLKLKDKNGLIYFFLFCFFGGESMAGPEWHHLPVQPAGKKKCVERRAEGQGGSRIFSSLPRKPLVLMNHGNTTRPNGFNYHLFIIHDVSHSANTIFYRFRIHCELNACAVRGVSNQRGERIVC